jgi:hypothetical protein
MEMGTECPTDTPEKVRGKAEDCEVRWLQHKPVEMAEYLQAVNCQRRVLATIGLERRPRELNSEARDLQRYMQYMEEATP